VKAIGTFLVEVQSGGWRAPAPDRVLATVLFTDIVESAARAVQRGDPRWRQLVADHHARVRADLARFGGTEIDTAGDGFFASFDGPARAIRCACAIRDSVHELGIDVRAGLHTGECEEIDGKFDGIAVITGARIAAGAEPNEVSSRPPSATSSRARDSIRGPRRPRAQGPAGGEAALRGRLGSAVRLDLVGGALFRDDPGREGVDAGLVAARAASEQLERPVDVDVEPFGQDSLCLLDRDPRLERALKLTRAFEQELGRVAPAAVGGRDDRERAFADVHLAARQPGFEEPSSDGLEQLD
jgi:class 3 adenylate cyclase